MKKFIRTCLSLDKKSIEKLNTMAKFYGIPKSDMIKGLIETYYDEDLYQDVIETEDQKANRERFFGWRK